MNETYEAILNHLLFHKAIISEEDGGEHVSRYMSMLQEIEQGQHIAVRDPLEKSIAAAFELVLEKQMDPWDINLAEFTKLYMEKVKDDGYVNFVTAGKLVFMAWSILKMQSDEVLTTAEPQQPEEFPFADWDLNLDIYSEARDLDYNQVVIKGATTPLQEAIRRKGKRAVTLMELMDAFDDAREEAERHLQLVALREQMSKIKPEMSTANIHSEDLLEDLRFTWDRISQHNGSPIPLVELYDGDVWDRVTVFTSILFLAKLQKVKIWQKKLPYGEIYLKRLTENSEVVTEDLTGIKSIVGEKDMEAVAVSQNA